MERRFLLISAAFWPSPPHRWQGTPLLWIFILKLFIFSLTLGDQTLWRISWIYFLYTILKIHLHNRVEVLKVFFSLSTDYEFDLFPISTLFKVFRVELRVDRPSNPWREDRVRVVQAGGLTTVRRVRVRSPSLAGHPFITLWILIGFSYLTLGLYK